jgi:hypothetical protein
MPRSYGDLYAVLRNNRTRRELPQLGYDNDDRPQLGYANDDLQPEQDAARTQRMATELAPAGPTTSFNPHVQLDSSQVEDRRS